MNVRDVISGIMELNGKERVKETCDVLLEGNWEEPVKGIAVTFMATVEVIRKAVDAGCNLIITHEPIYFTGQDKLSCVQNNPVYHKKKALI
ncbi:MAG: Nif3-like dinuclear metal center hexameric protein, partial [Chitinispirillaceae bacterium]|nr:Nif3-like dinuclear metal center hexameric protein [Chitinispirillaceae bacterium]